MTAKNGMCGEPWRIGPDKEGQPLWTTRIVNRNGSTVCYISGGEYVARRVVAAVNFLTDMNLEAVEMLVRAGFTYESVAELRGQLLERDDA